MEFTWHEEKEHEILAERGFNFDYAKRVFDDQQRVIEPDTRFDYEEDRFRVYGMIEGRVYVVIYTPRESLPYHYGMEG